MNVIDEIAAERKRQIEEEGWTADHDDQHTDGSLADAAACYAATAMPTEKRHTENYGVGEVEVPILWRWDHQWWKPKGRRRNLVRAGALIVAEIERLDRKDSDHAR